MQYMIQFSFKSWGEDLTFLHQPLGTSCLHVSSHFISTLEGFLSSYFRWGSWSSERSNNLPMVTQLGQSGNFAQIWLQSQNSVHYTVLSIQSSCFCTHLGKWRLFALKMFKKPGFPLMYNMNQCCTKIILNILWAIFILMTYSLLQKNMNL